MEAQKMIGHMIRRLHQKSTQVFTKRMTDAGHDLTAVQFSALDAIHSLPGSDQATIAEAIAYDRATIGGVIDRLERKGLVQRSVSPKDRRARVLHLTTAGERHYKDVLPVIIDLQDDILSGLTDEERSLLAPLIRKTVFHDT
ncbi:MarR family winged helix-turn-helix transcriptional regulator [Donghicola tyrosinivorans]|uniref:DNA-binding MarR family transcriptional regulator n=1 Tax=Donghicola tyrosinivorans TaxID=1652492 RepID=A0A2T0WRT8_9RHOB|nr:MarR family transcriptional regulator [Donghicola tyrosinivorans]PRY89421.1 DNA-binding MarR family transcriptional regulator [Donghicola tyrosinivorans]